MPHHPPVNAVSSNSIAVRCKIWIKVTNKVFYLIFPKRKWPRSAPMEGDLPMCIDVAKDCVRTTAATIIVATKC